MKCYLCKSENNYILSERVRDSNEISVLKCNNCELVFLNTFKHLNNELYENSKMHETTKFSIKNWLKESKNDDERRVKQFKKFIKDKVILDYGCGAGGFILNAKKIAKKTFGLELEKRVIDYWKSKLEIFPHLNDFNIKVDTITLFHVLEHLTDPIKTLKEIKKKLKKGSVVIIEVPNSDDALITLYKNKKFKDFTFWSKHTFLYNVKTLDLIAKKSGLKKIKIEQFQRYPLSNHLYWLSEGLPGGHKILTNFNRKNLINEYNNELLKLGKCDTIIGLFKL